MDDSDDTLFTPHLDGAKKQHYVPRFYLTGFTEKSLVARLDRRSGKVTSPTPEGTGYILNFYTFKDRQDRRRYDIEAMFGRYEAKAAPIILKMAAGARISLAEREDMAAFVAFAALRTPSAIDEAKAAHVGSVKAQVKTHLSDEWRAFQWLRKMHGGTVDENKLRQDAAGVSEMVCNDLYDMEVDHFFALGKSLRNFEAVATALYKRDWVVLHAPLGSQGFLTSDHPVVLTTRSSALRTAPLGYGSAHAQVLFPLTNSAALVMSGNQMHFGRAEIKPKALSRFNRTVAAYCQRYLYGKNANHLKAVADEIGLIQRPWTPSYAVHSRRSADGTLTGVFVLRTGESPLDKI